MASNARVSRWWRAGEHDSPPFFRRDFVLLQSLSAPMEHEPEGPEGCEKSRIDVVDYAIHRGAAAEMLIDFHAAFTGCHGEQRGSRAQRCGVASHVLWIQYAHLQELTKQVQPDTELTQSHHRYIDVVFPLANQRRASILCSSIR